MLNALVILMGFAGIREQVIMDDWLGSLLWGVSLAYVGFFLREK